jgi:hypothetical protein
MIILLFSACSDNTPKYSYVEGIGWRSGSDRAFTRDEYKEHCAEPLDFVAYQADPDKYKGILYKITGTVESCEPTSESSKHTYRIRILFNDILWHGIGTTDGEPHNIGDTITIYGSLQGIGSSSAEVFIRYNDFVSSAESTRITEDAIPIEDEEIEEYIETQELNEEAEQEEKPLDPPTTTVIYAGKMTLDKFNAIEIGMSYEKVCEIIGGEGDLLSEVDLGLGKEYASKMYMWEGVGSLGANANVTFQGDKVTMKAQFGLG